MGSVNSDNVSEEVSLDDIEAYLEWTRISAPKTVTPRNFDSAKDWRVAEALLKLCDELNSSYPSRDKSSDGTIGDAAHCGNSGTSDHCPNIQDGSKWVVAAFDATHDPASGCSMETVTEAIRRSKDSRIKYIIWNKRICSSYPADGKPAWTWRAYGGSNPHDKHAHFSVVSDKSKYDDRSNWTTV